MLLLYPGSRQRQTRFPAMEFPPNGFFFLIYSFTEGIALQMSQLYMRTKYPNSGLPWARGLVCPVRMLCLSPQVPKTHSLTPTPSMAAATPVHTLATLVVSPSPLPRDVPVLFAIFDQMFLGFIEGRFSGEGVRGQSLRWVCPLPHPPWVHLD